jgi:hypothetical protein
MIQKSNISILQSALTILQFALLVLHIETLFNSLLYTKFIIVFFMSLLTIMQLFIIGCFCSCECNFIVTCNYCYNCRYDVI